MPQDNADGIERAWSEELVTVGSRRLSRSEWEGEVMTAAAGWTAIAHDGTVFFFSFVWFVKDFRNTGSNNGLSCYGALMVIGVAEFFAASGVLGRGRRSRDILVGISLLWLLGIALFGLMLWSLNANAEHGPYLLLFLAANYIPELFILYALVGRMGRFTLAGARDRDPLSPLRSAWTVGGSVRAWAAYVMVWVTILLGGTLAAVAIFMPPSHGAL